MAAFLIIDSKHTINIKSFLKRYFLKPIKMKKIIYLPVVFAFILYSCSKSPVTKPVKFTATSYETLGTYTSTGMPDYLTTPDTISPDLLA